MPLDSPHPLRLRLARLAWAAVEMSLFRFSFHTLSPWRTFLLRCFGAKVGTQCRIRRTSHFYYPWNVVIGDQAVIGDHANLYSLTTITIGKGATISQESYLCAGTHDYTRRDLPLIKKPVTIAQDAWVCARAFIGPGITVGEGAVVAACAVVIKDVAPWTIVGGNPAKFIKHRELSELKKA